VFVAENKRSRYWTIAIIALVAVIIVSSTVAWTRCRPAQPVEIILPTETTISGNINIHGAVSNPGIYQFSGDDSLSSLLKSAGGVTADGKPDTLELYLPPTNVSDNAQKININTAADWLLEALPGIGTTKAKAIIDYRTKNGFFRSVDELTKVTGISQNLLDQIKPFITVSD
jgi:competence protein ComEA